MRQRTPSRAAFELAVAGGDLQRIADALGFTTSYIGHMLSGRRPVHPGLEIALRAVVGPEGAQRVLEAIPEKR